MCSLKSAVWTEAGQLNSMRMRSDGNLIQSSSQLLAVLQGELIMVLTYQKS